MQSFGLSFFFICVIKTRTVEPSDKFYKGMLHMVL